jgi:hypothetical protein
MADGSCAPLAAALAGDVRRTATYTFWKAARKLRWVCKGHTDCRSSNMAWHNVAQSEDLAPLYQDAVEAGIADDAYIYPQQPGYPPQPGYMFPPQQPTVFFQPLMMDQQPMMAQQLMMAQQPMIISPQQPVQAQGCSGSTASDPMCRCCDTCNAVGKQGACRHVNFTCQRPGGALAIDDATGQALGAGEFLLAPRLHTSLRGLSGGPEARLHNPTNRGNLEFLRMILDILAKCMLDFVQWAKAAGCSIADPEHGNSRQDPHYLLNTCKYLFSYAMNGKTASILLQDQWWDTTRNYLYHSFDYLLGMRNSLMHGVHLLDKDKRAKKHERDKTERRNNPRAPNDPVHTEKSMRDPQYVAGCIQYAIGVADVLSDSRIWKGRVDPRVYQDAAKTLRGVLHDFNESQLLTERGYHMAKAMSEDNLMMLAEGTLHHAVQKIKSGDLSWARFVCQSLAKFTNDDKSQRRQQEVEIGVRLTPEQVEAKGWYENTLKRARQTLNVQKRLKALVDQRSQVRTEDASSTMNGGASGGAPANGGAPAAAKKGDACNVCTMYNVVHQQKADPTVKVEKAHLTKHWVCMCANYTVLILCSLLTSTWVFSKAGSKHKKALEFAKRTVAEEQARLEAQEQTQEQARLEAKEQARLELKERNMLLFEKSASTRIVGLQRPSLARSFTATMANQCRSRRQVSGEQKGAMPRYPLSPRAAPLAGDAVPADTVQEWRQNWQAEQAGTATAQTPTLVTGNSPAYSPTSPALNSFALNSDNDDDDDDDDWELTYDREEKEEEEEEEEKEKEKEKEEEEVKEEEEGEKEETKEREQQLENFTIEEQEEKATSATDSDTSATGSDASDSDDDMSLFLIHLANQGSRHMPKQVPALATTKVRISLMYA